MGIINKTLTDREKAAIYLHVFGGFDNWTELYLIASDESNENARKKARPADNASKWKRSPKIQNYIETVRAERFRMEEKAREKGRAEERGKDSERSENEPEKAPAKFVDYSDPANQRRKLNELVNRASDPGEALDALKVIISGQRDDKQAAKERRQVAAYLPICCNDCPLYQKARKRAEKAL